jgi:hypothetical protein
VIVFPDIDDGEQPAGLLLAEHRRFAALDDVLGPAHRMRRIDRENLADDEPVEQHADRGQMLLDGRSRGRALLDGAITGVRHPQRQIGGNVERLDIGELVETVLLEPGEERAHGPVIGHPRVVVLD